MSIAEIVPVWVVLELGVVGLEDWCWGGHGGVVPESLVAPCVVAVHCGEECGAIEPELECGCDFRGAEIGGRAREQGPGVAVH